MSGHDVHRTRLALLVAVLDGDCQQRVHDLLCDPGAPHLAVEVAHRLAHDLVASIDRDDHGAMRDDLAAELLHLAADDDST